MIGMALVCMAFSQRSISGMKEVKMPDASGARAGVVDTLILHMIGSNPTIYSVLGGGYVGGHNTYGDISKMQKFDQTYGVSDFGTITGILFWFGHAEGDTTHTFNANIWDDNAGVPGTVIGSETVPYAAIDTSVAYSIGGYTEVGYNTVSTFSNPVNIPSNKTFWAGIGITYAAGDSVGLVTSADGEFTDAITHTFEEWSDNSFHTFNDGTNSTWQLDVALAIFPVMDFVVNVDGNDPYGVKLYNNYPNPANTETSVMFDLARDMQVTLSVFDVTGRQVIHKDAGMMSAGKRRIDLNVSDLPAGVYSYTLNAGGSLFNNQMVVVR